MSDRTQRSRADRVKACLGWLEFMADQKRLAEVAEQVVADRAKLSAAHSELARMKEREARKGPIVIRQPGPVELDGNVAYGNGQAKS